MIDIEKIPKQNVVDAIIQHTQLEADFDENNIY